MEGKGRGLWKGWVSSAQTWKRLGVACGGLATAYPALNRGGGGGGGGGTLRSLAALAAQQKSPLHSAPGRGHGRPAPSGS